MRVMFWGLGSIGKRHAKILKRDSRYQLFAFRSQPHNPLNELGIPEVYSWRQVERIRPHVAFITNPTYLHLQTAIECAQRGIHLFIEKPLGSQPYLLDPLLKIVAKKKIATYVAYVLRFHPVIKALRNYIQRYKFLHMRVMASSHLAQWRPGGDHLRQYSARDKLGGGVIYDLSHELDYVGYILGDIRQLTGQFAKRSQVTVDAEDFADILVRTKKGPASIHINFLSQIRQRWVQIDFEEKSVVGDLLKNVMVEYKKGKPSRKIKYHVSIDDCLERQINYFFANIRKKRMMNDIFEASGLLRKIYSFRGQN